MKVKIVITIEAEEDQWGEYKTDGFTANNVINGLPIIQDIFEKYGAFPTYLINYPVATDGNVIKLFQKMLSNCRCEIGTHCHPWNTPPFEEGINPHNTMLCNLPYEIVYKKLKILHGEIVDRFKVAPISFRAGRWGFGPSVAQAIYGLGYRIDTSITPFCDWTSCEGPDFRHVSPYPYKFELGDIFSNKENGCVLEIPPSIGFLQKNQPRCGQIRGNIFSGPFKGFHLLGMLDRIRILNRRCLSPELCNGSEMILLAERLMKSGCQVLNMFFHSNSLLEGAGPFVQSQERLWGFLHDIEIFLQFAANEGMIFSALSECLK